MLLTKPEKFGNDVLTLKKPQMFSVNITPEKFENATFTGHFGFVGAFHYAKPTGQRSLVIHGENGTIFSYESGPTNWPFPSSLSPPFQNEPKCETIHMKTSSAYRFIFI